VNVPASIGQVTSLVKIICGRVLPFYYSWLQFGDYNNSDKNFDGESKAYIQLDKGGKTNTRVLNLTIV
jgi:hypothetical protein